MNNGYGSGSQPDGWDIWQFISYVATGLSVVALFASGKQGKELGQAGAVLGIGSSALHKFTAPPRCAHCRCRMTRVQGTAAGNWWCYACGYGTA